ncbi:phosphatase PAP2 family protein [Candidatus Woesearchaeota archaeon]|nr:hypothetical protein [uncultured archaeon]MBS3124424.1 phosphatase PAP2 family protein [Candidatus Woesearchaeota archaeon]
MKLKQLTEMKFIYEFLRDLTALGGTILFLLILPLALVVKEYQLFWQLLFGYCSTMIVVVLIRTFYYKDRPNKEAHHNYLEKLDASSFPSWHTARALFLALIFSEKFNYFPLTVFLITITVIVAYSRLYLKKHDIIDVMGGMVLGGVAFWLAVKLI